MSPAKTTPAKGKASDAVFALLVAATTATILVALYFIFVRAPIERTMGVVYRIFYFHVPSAIGMYIGAGACFVGSAGYLRRPSTAWDAFARAGAEAAVVFGAILLITGMLWGAKAWGYYWTWDPRLTTSLLQVLIYVAYLVLRTFSDDGEGTRKFAAALGVLGAFNLPIIHLSVQKWSGQHPQVVTGNGGGLSHPDMVTALLVSLLAFTLFSVALIWARTRVELAQERFAILQEDAIDLGLDDRIEA